MILKLYGLVEAVLDKLINVEYHWFRIEQNDDHLLGPDGQWQLAQMDVQLTPKGINVIDALMTIIHNGMDFVAQFFTLLPAMNSVPYNTLQLWGQM